MATTLTPAWRISAQREERVRLPQHRADDGYDSGYNGDEDKDDADDDDDGDDYDNDDGR